MELEEIMAIHFKPSIPEQLPIGKPIYSHSEVVYTYNDQVQQLSGDGEPSPKPVHVAFIQLDDKVNSVNFYIVNKHINEYGEKYYHLAVEARRPRGGYIDVEAVVFFREGFCPQWWEWNRERDHVLIGFMEEKDMTLVEEEVKGTDFADQLYWNDFAWSKGIWLVDQMMDEQLMRDALHEKVQYMCEQVKSRTGTESWIVI